MWCGDVATCGGMTWWALSSSGFKLPRLAMVLDPRCPDRLVRCSSGTWAQWPLGVIGGSGLADTRSGEMLWRDAELRLCFCSWGIRHRSRPEGVVGAT